MTQRSGPARRARLRAATLRANVTSHLNLMDQHRASSGRILPGGKDLPTRCRSPMGSRLQARLIKRGRAAPRPTWETVTAEVVYRIGSVVCGRRPDSPVDDRVGARTTQAWPSPSARGAGLRTQRRSQVLASSPPWRSPPPPTGLAGCDLTETPADDPLGTAVNAALVTLAASRSSRGPLLHPCRRCGRPEPKLAAGAPGPPPWSWRSHRSSHDTPGDEWARSWGPSAQVVLRWPSDGFHGLTALIAAAIALPCLVPSVSHQLNDVPDRTRHLTGPATTFHPADSFQDFSYSPDFPTVEQGVPLPWQPSSRAWRPLPPPPKVYGPKVPALSISASVATLGATITIHSVGEVIGQANSQSNGDSTRPLRSGRTSEREITPLSPRATRVMYSRLRSSSRLRPHPRLPAPAPPALATTGTDVIASAGIGAGAVAVGGLRHLGPAVAGARPGGADRPRRLPGPRRSQVPCVGERRAGHTSSAHGNPTVSGRSSTFSEVKRLLYVGTGGALHLACLDGCAVVAAATIGEGNLDSRSNRSVRPPDLSPGPRAAQTNDRSSRLSSWLGARVFVDQDADLHGQHAGPCPRAVGGVRTAADADQQDPAASQRPANPHRRPAVR